jgi:hypothetical protein
MPAPSLESRVLLLKNIEGALTSLLQRGMLLVAKGSRQQESGGQQGAWASD